MSTRNQDPLRRLIAAARKARAPQAAPPADAPFGFATRVAARWADARGRASHGELWERFCWWGASVSVAVCLAAFTYQAVTPERNAFDLLLEIPAASQTLP